MHLPGAIYYGLMNTPKKPLRVSILLHTTFAVIHVDEYDPQVIKIR